MDYSYPEKPQLVEYQGYINLTIFKSVLDINSWYIIRESDLNKLNIISDKITWVPLKNELEVLMGHDMFVTIFSILERVAIPEQFI